jgi:hypothetical protein
MLSSYSSPEARARDAATIVWQALQTADYGGMSYARRVLNIRTGANLTLSAR